MKSRTIKHPTGVEIETPLLIPSFSSKGFALLKKKINNKPKEVSEIYDVLNVPAQELLHESLLVSAYDVYHGYIPPLSEIGITNVVFIDSGGYETSESFDISGVNKTRHEVLDWGEEELIRTLSSCPEETSFVIVNFDHGEIRLPFEDQIQNADKFFSQFRNRMLTDFLIKPEKKQQPNVVIDDLLRSIHSLNKFDIIGLTEKELGNSIYDRMINVKKVRKSLDSNGLADKPIHVFGSLDPVTSVLYFFAGAEIFDGLTWLKFSYHNGMAIYTHNFSVLSEALGVQSKDKAIALSSLISNVNYLEKLKFAMRDFSKTRSFDSFNYLNNDKLIEVFEECYNRVKD
ncbi:hypothetical protein [Roseivirga thermotolerans]|uniref:Uncharacterized protein n=1 Tax=Roseivirga thermotolerans TaxID=1758176 RepID=A0ABQ3IC94_9BACT|nr:hypothetical protein [Roseivirga thermotolerans]GHE74576.1 hypothetical protein GCM10011340_34040 [Roseivirga thermotolerans]